MPPFNVPQELIEIIIDEVASIGDEAQRLSALRACSRTSWSFLTPSRRYLFEEVALVEDAGDDTEAGLQDRSRLQSFLQILENDPCLHMEHQHLSMHIKSLNIELSGARAARNKRGFRERNQERSFLPSILQLIHQIHTFRLSFDLRQTSVSWVLVDDSLKEALTQFCTSQPIAGMELQNIDGLPLTLMTDCLSLVSLSVHSLTCINEQYLRTLPQSSFSALGNLSVISSPDFIEVLQSVPLRTSSTLKFPHSSLRRLETPLGRIEWEFIRSLPSLSYLCVSRISETFNRYSYLDLRRLQMLRHLKFKWDFGNNVGMMTLLPVIAWPKPGADPEIEDFSAPKTAPITMLEIFGQWNFCTRRNEQRHLMASAGWNALDGVLSGDMFCNLRFIRFDLTLRYTDTLPSPKSVEKYLLTKVTAKLPELLPVLSTSNSIEIRLEIHVAGYD